MPIALWCVLIAGVLPILTAGLAKAGDKAFDNGDARGWAGSLQGWRKRAYAAHQNGFESFPLFAAAALVAVTQGQANATADLLAVTFIVARLGYVACYVADLPTLRSAIWSVGLFATIALFTLPAWG